MILWFCSLMLVTYLGMIPFSQPPANLSILDVLGVF